jgi:hypothetical protein
MNLSGDVVEDFRRFFDEICMFKGLEKERWDVERNKFVRVPMGFKASEMSAEDGRW